MSTTTELTELKINYLTEAQYQAEVSGGTIDENALYMTPASGGGGSGISIAKLTCECTVTKYSTLLQFSLDASSLPGPVVCFNLYYDVQNPLEYISFPAARDDTGSIYVFGIGVDSDELGIVGILNDSESYPCEVYYLDV